MQQSSAGVFSFNMYVIQVECVCDTSWMHLQCDFWTYVTRLVQELCVLVVLNVDCTNIVHIVLYALWSD